MRIKTIPVLGSLLLLGGMLLADDYNRKTTVTFSEPVMVAGVPVVTLEPGTYVLKLVGSQNNRNIVQVFNERGNKLFTTVLAIANFRVVRTGKSQFTFWETPQGNPPALRAWFYPGDHWGQEFVYPKGLAAKLARDTGETVLTTPAETIAEFKTAPVAEVTKAGEEKPLEEAYIPPAEAAATEPAPAVTKIAAAAPAELPATGSPFFAIGLIGLMAAAAGLTLRRLAYRKS